MRTGVVRGGEGTHHELSWLNGLDRAADFLDESAVFMPHRCGSGNWLQTSVRPEVRSTHARQRQADQGIGRFYDFRILTLLEAHIKWAVKNRSSHHVLLLV